MRATVSLAQLCLLMPSHLHRQRHVLFTLSLSPSAGCDVDPDFELCCVACLTMSWMDMR